MIYMAETIKATIQLRRATEAKWNEIGSIFIPKEGEPCLTLDGENAGKVKYGDGINTWSNLLYAGRDGPDGTPGLPGQDGFSPTVQTAAIDGGTRVTITDADGPKTFDVLNGTNGEDGEPGQDGAPGQDGFSPTASVTQTEDGAKITITDKSGTTNATITNGKDGTNGTDGADGQTPNITPGNIETLPAGSDVTASITGQTPNLVLNLGIPRGPAGAGVPSTEGVPTDYLLSPSGWVAPPSGGGNTWKLIRDITLAEDVKSINIETDSVGLPFSCDEIYINTNATNVAKQTVATSLIFGINGRFTMHIGTTSPMLFDGGKNGETGRNWAWVRSINPLIVLTGSWVTTNTSSKQTVYCYQPNDINSDDISFPAIKNPYDIGEKISDIEIAGAISTSFFSAGSRFLVYGR